MLAMCVSLFPILVTTFCLLCRKNALLSLLIGSFVGIAIFEFQCEFSLESIIEILYVIFDTILDNATVLIGILLLFFLVFLISHSSVIVALNNMVEQYVCSSLQIVIILLILGAIFSLDDYLLCMATAMILTDIAVKHGFSREKITYLINITSVSLCCLSPFSSWMPVIKRTLKISGLDESIIYKTLPYNFAAIIGLLFVIIVGLFKPLAFKSTQKNKSAIIKANITRKDNKLLSPEILAFCILCAVLVGSLIFMTLIKPCSNAVIKSSAVSILIGVPLFIKTNALQRNQILSCVKDSFESTWDLSRLLILIWLLTNICRTLLNMDTTVTNYVHNSSFQITYIPVAIFLLSGIFAFFTGSSYGTFGLFIPIAVQITGNSNYKNLQIVTIAAAISGSLIAASSFTSDTLKITSKNTKGDIEYLQFAQLPYSLLQFISSSFAFYLAGLFAPYGHVYSIMIPLFTIICLWVSYLILYPLVYNIYEEKIYVVHRYLTTDKLSNIQILTTNIYTMHKHTFRSLWWETEKSINIKNRLIQASIPTIHKQLYPLKMPGL